MKQDYMFQNSKQFITSYPDSKSSRQQGLWKEELDQKKKEKKKSVL